MANDRLFLVHEASGEFLLLAKWSAGIGWCATSVDLDKFFESIPKKDGSDTLDGQDFGPFVVWRESDENFIYREGKPALRDG